VSAVAELTVEVAGAPARVLHAAGEGGPVVLIHGASGCADSWRGTLGAWSGQDVWAPDLPGRGGSAGPARDRAEATAAWLGELAEVCGWRRPVLVGHSYGGAVALQAALLDPDRWGGVALVASGGRLRVSPAILAAVAESSPDAPFRLDAAFGPGTPAAVVEAYAEATRSVPPTSALADWRACDAFDVLARLEEVRCPTLVVYASDDALTPPKHQRAMAARIPGAIEVALEGFGHMLPWEAPGAVARAVQAWRAGH